MKVDWIVQENRTLEGKGTCLAAVYDTLFDAHIALWLRNEFKAAEAKREINNDQDNITALRRYRESNELMVSGLANRFFFIVVSVYVKWSQHPRRSYLHPGNPGEAISLHRKENEVESVIEKRTGMIC